MLTVSIPPMEFFNEETESFVYSRKESLTLVHSLVSISKWESRWKKPFLSTTTSNKTHEEVVDYIRCMAITQSVNSVDVENLPRDVLDQIINYINDPMTATWFPPDNGGKRGKTVITSEVIYYWMISLNIPMECEKWHLNRLLTLIQVCNLHLSPKKMSKKEQLAQQRAVNEARRSKLNSKG